MIDGNEDDEEDQRGFHGTEVYRRGLFRLGLFVLKDHRLRFVVLLVVHMTLDARRVLVF